MKNPVLDEIDSKILRILLIDSRTPISEIAKELNLSRPTVRKRLERLINTGVIKGYTINIGEKYLDYTTIVFILKPEKQDKIFEQLKNIEEVSEIYQLEGSKDIICFVEIKDMKNLQKIISKFSKMEIKYDIKIASKRLRKNITYDRLARLGLVTLVCDYCGKKIVSEPLTYTLYNRKYYFCCPTCLREYKKKIRKTKKL